MSLVVFLILLALFGLVTGALARLLLRARSDGHRHDDPGRGAGSFAAGLFSWYVSYCRHGASLVLSVVFSMLLLFALRRSGARRS